MTHEITWRGYLGRGTLAVCGLIAVCWLLNSASRIDTLQMTEAASDAQARCYRLIHDDTFAFQDCVQRMLADQHDPTPRRLGVEYFGFVGALNSARMGMRGAEGSARTFLQRVRATQHALGVDDAALCSVIAGDCAARTARMKLMEATPQPGSVDFADTGEREVHGH